MQDTERDNNQYQYSEGERPQQSYQVDYSYARRDSNNSFKRTKGQFESQHNQSNRMKMSQLKELNGINYPQRNQMSKASSNQGTIYNVGRNTKTPLTSKVITQTFKVPNRSKSFRAVSNQTTQTNNNKQSSNNDPTNYNYNEPLNDAHPSNRLLEERIRNDDIDDDDESVTEFALNDNRVNSNLNFTHSVYWKQDYNEYCIIFGMICAGGLICFLVYDHLKKNSKLLEDFPNKIKQMISGFSTEVMISFGVILACGVAYVIWRQKDTSECELIANEDYKELKALLASSINNDPTFIGIFIDFFIQTRVEYWNIAKYDYERKILPMLKSNILQEKMIEECEMIVSNQSLRLWKSNP